MLLLLGVNGCSPLSTFPFPETTIIKTEQDFSALNHRSPHAKNRALQLTGRIIRSEMTPQNVSFHAEWLPFPENVIAGPERLSTGQFNRRFSMQFSGAIDGDGRRQGNEFLMVGQFVGMQETWTLHGISKSIPHFLVQCLHIWKTADTDLVEFIWMDPLDESYPPSLEETYCVSSSTS